MPFGMHGTVGHRAMSTSRPWPKGSCSAAQARKYWIAIRPELLPRAFLGGTHLQMCRYTYVHPSGMWRNAAQIASLTRVDLEAFAAKCRAHEGTRIFTTHDPIRFCFVETSFCQLPAHPSFGDHLGGRGAREIHEYACVLGRGELPSFLENITLLFIWLQISIGIFYN